MLFTVQCRDIELLPTEKAGNGRLKTSLATNGNLANKLVPGDVVQNQAMVILPANSF